jgi:hypothetical protein
MLGQKEHYLDLSLPPFSSGPVTKPICASGSKGGTSQRYEWLSSQLRLLI